jgi:hypothetical protein
MNEDLELDFLGDVDPEELERAAKAAKEDMKAEAKNTKDAEKSRGHTKEGSAG